MAIELSKERLRFSFPGALDVTQFDGRDHGLSHCMKAVDLIVEYPNHSLFVEVKDPDNPHARLEQRRRFHADLQSDVLLRKLVEKYRDSLLYRWAMGKLDKPVRYAVLLEFAALGAPDYLRLTERLQRRLPLVGTPARWQTPLAVAVEVFDMARWNRQGRLGRVERF